MDLQKLSSFIKFAAESTNPFIRQQANIAAEGLQEAGEDEKEQTPDLKAKAPFAEKSMDAIDLFMEKALPELKNPDSNDTRFGKVGSAYVRDIKINQLSDEVKKEIARFIPNNKATAIFYGMVVDELLPKVDPKNFEIAEEHVHKNHRGQNREKLKDDFLTKAKSKFILMMNDKIVDGHHHLAKAKDLGVTSSLNVLDLTPARVSEKSSAFKKLAHRLK